MKTSDFNAKAEAVLDGRGWMTQMARITGKDYATVKRWASGELPVPDYAVAIVELLEIVPAAMRPARFHRPARATPKAKRRKRK